MCSHLDDRPDGGFEIVSFRLRGVENLDGVGSAGNVHERRVVEVVLELARVQGGAHDHQLQVGPDRKIENVCSDTGANFLFQAWAEETLRADVLAAAQVVRH